MAGGTAQHASFSLDVANALKNHLRGTPCQSFMAEIKLHVQASDAFFNRMFLSPAEQSNVRYSRPKPMPYKW